MMLEVALGILHGVMNDGDDLSVQMGELLMLLRQLTEVLAAEGSHEAAQEDQDYAAPPAIVAEGDLSPCDGDEGEVRRD